MPPRPAILILLSAILPGAALAGCPAGKPLLSVFWQETPPEPGEKGLGEWRLPISADEPDLVTHARVAARFVHAGKGWAARLDFSFPDPEPYGLPFTFQRVSIERAGEEGRREAVLDWSFECADPGRSLFPGQSWSVEIPVGEPEGFDDPEVFTRLSLRLWGSRN
jgi:hypothetical protein